MPISPHESADETGEGDMSWMKHLGGRLPDFEAVMRRFPITLAIMAIFTIWIIAQNQGFSVPYDREEFVYLGFISAAYVTVIVTLMTEARNGSAAFGALIALTLAVLTFLLSYFSKALDFTAPMVTGAAILFLGNAAAWRAGRQDRNVWNFTQKLWTGALFATVGSVIFLLGMVAISEAVRALFGVDLNDLTLETILPIGLAFLAPVYWLGTLPRYGEAEDVTELSFEARALSFLGTWMLAPLVIIYALIVLAYGAKVLFQWELPKGEIAQLVSPFIGVGMLVWLMLEPKVLKESGFVRFYRAAWHWIMLPAAVLLGVAVFVRVQALGFTVIRVFLALVVIWAIVQSLWFLFMPKARRDIRVPTALAAGLLIFGAFAAGPMSLMSQYNKAKQVQRDLPIFDADTLRKTPVLAARFLGGLKYLIQRGDEKRFKKLLPDAVMPANTYGDEYTTLLKTLGLDKLDSSGPSQFKNFSISSESVIEVNANSQIIFGPTLTLRNSRKMTSAVGILTSQDGYEIVLTIDEDIYRVNLKEAFSKVDFVGSNDWQKDTNIPAIFIESDSGITARLLVLNGKLNFRSDTLFDGNIDFAVIVPN